MMRSRNEELLEKPEKTICGENGMKRKKESRERGRKG